MQPTAVMASPNMNLFRILCVEIDLICENAGADQNREGRKSDHHLQRNMQSMRHRVPPSSESRQASESVRASPHTPCIGSIAPGIATKVNFLQLSPTSTKFHPRNHPKVAPGKAKRPP